MTWVSHIAVGTATAKLFDFSYILAAFGSILPDLAEKVIPKNVAHRGITHSVALWLASLVLLWWHPQVRDVILGVCVGHLLMDSLTVMGVPVLDENSKRLTLFGGKIRTGTAGEFVVAGVYSLIVFVFLGSFSISSAGEKKPGWKDLHEKGVIDRREYKEHRFQIL